MRAANTSREQLLHLLAEAAELEHNLLCCYLYAAFSLKGSAPGLSENELALIARWRKVLMAIAFEEMTHLAIVANLTVAVGARPHFNRPNLPVAPGYHPASIVVKLAPFSPETLDHFIFLERPAQARLADGAGFDTPGSVAREPPPSRRLMPGAPDYETVAEFYDEIRGCLVSLATELGDEALFCAGEGPQLGHEALPMPGLTTIDSLSKALGALDTIVEQGEGSASDAEASHFSRFQEMRREYERRLASRGDVEPAWPAAPNPGLWKTDLRDRVHIDASPAVEILDLANAMYNLLLRALTQAYGRGPGSARSGDPRLALRLMAAFSRTGEYLATLPAGESHPGIHAGVSFTILRATEPLVEGVAESRLLEERLRELTRRTAALCDVHPALRSVLHLLGDAR